MRGGLGNQLFILAFAYYIAKINNEEAVIVIDTREYDTYKIRNFELFDLVEDTKLIMSNSSERHPVYDLTRKLFHVAQWLNRNETSSISLLGKLGLYYGRRSPRNIPCCHAKESFIYGYFQDVDITNQVRDRLINNINIEGISVDGFDCNKPAIAVSIRWGQDYVDAGWPICRSQYFKDGIDYIIEKKYKKQDVQVLIFSDEIDKAKEVQIYPDALFIEGLSSTEQIAIMMQCSDYVLANSSFSWWGAYLGKRDDSIVIMPEYWYEGNVLTKDTKLVYENCIII